MSGLYILSYSKVITHFIGYIVELLCVISHLFDFPRKGFLHRQPLPKSTEIRVLVLDRQGLSLYTVYQKCTVCLGSVVCCSMV